MHTILHSERNVRINLLVQYKIQFNNFRAFIDFFTIKAFFFAKRPLWSFQLFSVVIKWSIFNFRFDAEVCPHQCCQLWLTKDILIEVIRVGNTDPFLFRSWNLLILYNKHIKRDILASCRVFSKLGCSSSKEN